MNVYQSITQVKAALGSVGKNKEMKSGPQYSYRSIDDVLNKAHDGLVERGVIFAPNVRSIQQSEAGRQIRTIVHVDYAVYGPEGDSIYTSVLGEACDTGDKGTNKAMTAAFKVLLTQLFAIPFNTDDPDDHHVDTSESKGESKPAISKPAPLAANRLATRATTKPKETTTAKMCGTCTYVIGTSDPVKMQGGKPHHKACLTEGKQINTPAATEALIKEIFTDKDGNEPVYAPGEEPF